MNPRHRAINDGKTERDWAFRQHCAADGEPWPCRVELKRQLDECLAALPEPAPAPASDALLRSAAMSLFEPMDHGSQSKPNAGHTIESHCRACVNVRAKRTTAIRRALVQLGDLPAVGLRAALEGSAVVPQKLCLNDEWDSRYACVKPKDHPLVLPGLTDHDYQRKGMGVLRGSAVVPQEGEER